MHQGLTIDCTKFKPALIAQSGVVLQPQKVQTATWSHWDLTVSVGSPLDYNQDCYIKWYLPNELKYDVKSMQASGIFLGKDSNG